MDTSEVYTPEQFKEWIRSRRRKEITLNDSVENEWLLETDWAVGRIIFHKLEIIELMIENKKDHETAFYLHFQLNDREHAENLYIEMEKTLLSMKEKQKLRVLLCCSGGLTTSYFAEELNNAAENLQLDYEFAAINYGRLYEKGFDYDVILLAPQIRYELKKAREIFRRQTVLGIPAAVFGSYKSGELIEMIMTEINAKKNTDPETEAIRHAFDNDNRILCIALINHNQSYRIGYCIYDHGKRTLDKEVIKDTHSFQDIEDLLDYVLVRHKNIDAIAIAYPGIIWRGRIHHPDYKLSNQFNMGAYLEQKYGHKVFLINDVNALALGYHALHENSDNIVFYFQPRGDYLAGAGLITDGRLQRGWKSSAGEIGRLIPAMVDEPEKKINDPKGALEIVTKGILAFITTFAPEKIIVYSELTPDTEEIRSQLKKYVDEEYIPEIIWTDTLKHYILPGAMIHGLDVLRRLELDPEYYQHLEEKHTMNH